jgi:hypothetical protein
MEALLTAYSLSGAAGIRVSWAMLVVSWCVHFGYLHPNPSMAWVGAWWMILLAFTASLVDLVGDKIPVLDHALHGVHVFLAPIAGAISAVSGYHGEGAVSALLAVIGGTNAFVLHASRTTVRAASSATTLGLANPVISILEDIAAVVFIVIAMLAPALTAVLLVAATVWIIRKARHLALKRQRAAA